MIAPDTWLAGGLLDLSFRIWKAFHLLFFLGLVSGVSFEDVAAPSAENILQRVPHEVWAKSLLWMEDIMPHGNAYIAQKKHYFEWSYTLSSTPCVQVAQDILHPPHDWGCGLDV